MDLTALANMAKVAQQESKKEDFEFRYQPRIGPTLTPEPEFIDVEQTSEMFDIDPDTTLLITAKTGIDQIIKAMQLHMSIEFHHPRNTIYTDALTKKREITALDFQELSTKCIDSYLKASQDYCSSTLVDYVVNLLDELLSSMRDSLVKQKRKIAVKLTNARDACNLYKISLERAFEHSKAETIRITANISEDKFKNENVELTQLYEAADYGSRILTKKVEWYAGEVSKKESQVNDLSKKLEKALKKVFAFRTEVDILRF